MKNLETIKKHGNEWQKNGYHRIYFSEDTIYAANDFQFEKYKSGSISSAKYQGNDISNSKASKLLFQLKNSKNYYDVSAEKYVGEYAEKIKNYIEKN